MKKEMLQHNLKTWITDEVINGERIYKIIDGEKFPMEEAHVFHIGKVKDLGSSAEAYQRMATEINQHFCDWYAKNSKEVRKFYENQ